MMGSQHVVVLAFALVAIAGYAESAGILFEDGVQQVTIRTSKVIEASGMAASRQHTTRVWLLNDSGDEARVVAVSIDSGNRRGMLTFSGAENKDWEDLAVGRGPNNKQYIYVVDTGYANSNIVVLYRVREPSSLSTATVTPDVLRVNWPHSTRDCEALMVDENGVLYIIAIARAGQRARIYQVPSSGWNSDEPVNLRQGTDMPVVNQNNKFPRAADISPDGSEILMSDHAKNYYWKRRSGESVIAAVTSRNPIIVPQVNEDLRETIAWTHDGDGYYTVSEGSSETISYFKRQDPNKPVVPVVTLPPGRTGDKLAFTSIGDWGSPGSSQRDVADKMASWAKTNNADFILALGDNFYENGIKSYTDSQVENTWRQVYDQSALMKTWYVIAGNHDHRYDRAEYQVQLSRHDSRWYFPSLYYSFYKQAGSQQIHFIMLDTQTGRYGTDTTQLNWFKKELQNSKGDWIIVCGHHPVFSTGTHGKFSSTRGMYEHFRPLLEQYKVALYIAGHDHFLEHLARTKSNHIVDYIISGSGSKLRTQDSTAKRDVEAKGAKSIMNRQQYGFNGFVIQGDYITVSYVDKYGNAFYKFNKKNPKA